MDPLTAISLAGTIVQFVDFGTKLLLQGNELYKSATGALIVDEELELVTTDLKALVAKVRRTSISRATGGATPPNKEDEEFHKRFEDICDEAVKVAGKLLGKLESVHVDGFGNKHKKWHTFQALVKRLWTKDEIDELLGRLSKLKDALDTRMLYAIVEHQDIQSIHTNARFDRLDQQSQRILCVLLESNHTSQLELISAITQLVRRLEAFNKDEHQRTREMITERRKTPFNQARFGKLGRITADIEMLDVSQVEENLLRKEVGSLILKTLQYPTMSNRYEAVVDAYPRTFEWAFEDSTEEQLPWANFSTWLSSGSGVYWVSGKPGSGKSTLMKHIYDDHRTRRLLKQWAQRDAPADAPLCLATFYFWNSGTPEQKSQTGMLRSLLSQVLSQQPELIPIVIPLTWARYYANSSNNDKGTTNLELDFTEQWSVCKLVSAFELLLKQQEIPIKLCFIVDGLDEFEGDHEELMDLFRDIADARFQNVKACLSSRPWPIFKDSFSASPTLQLQHLTFNDIKHYVSGRFGGNRAFQTLSSKDPVSAAALIQEIVEKADGVFLWVWIVVQDLLRGIRNLDSIPDLWDRLRTLPKDLEPLYKHLMGRIEPRYLKWTSKVLQIARAVRKLDDGYLKLLDVHLAVDQPSSVETLRYLSREDIIEKCYETEVRIMGRCACLLEVSLTKQQSTLRPDSSVQYLHRTARDFVEDEGRWRDLLSYTKGTNFDPYVSLMQCYNLRLRIFLNGNPMHWNSHKLASMALLCASFADVHTESHDTQFRILENIDAIMTTRYQKQWCAQHTLPVSNDLQFIEVAAAMNLSGYLSIKLARMPEAPRKKTATSLLRLRVLTGSGPALTIDMAHVLIKSGADVNDNYQDSTVWKVFLRKGITMLESLDSTNGDENVSTTNEFDYMRIMKLFILSGADTRVSVQIPRNVHSLDSDIVPIAMISISDFAAKYLCRLYPESEVEGVIEELQKVSPANKN